MVKQEIDLKLAVIEIKQAMEAQNVSMYALAKKVGVTPKTVENFLKEKNIPNIVTYKMMQDALHISDKNCQLPYLGDVNGGSLLALEDKLQELREHHQGNDRVEPPMIPVPNYVKGGFVLRLIGDSMNKLIPEGYYLVVDSSRTNPQELDGKVVIVRKDKEYSCKRFNRTLMLAEPASTETYESINMRDFDTEIIGQVVQTFQNF